MLKWVERILSVIGVVAATTGLVLLTVSLSSHYLDQKYADAHQGCFPNQAAHTMIIQNDKVAPNHINALRCDSLTIINRDMTERMIAFGPHEDHVAYDGVKEKMVGHNGALTVTLVEAGSFRFHDHIHDEVQATFNVY